MTLGPDKDLTVTPIVRIGGDPDSAGAVGDIEYRQRVRDGGFRLELSGTYEDRVGNDNTSIVKNNELRGHFEGDGLFEINRDWRWGFNSKVATDKSYLSQYHFGSPDWLESQLWAEGFFGRSYFDARAMGFQSTDKDFGIRQRADGSAVAQLQFCRRTRAVRRLLGPQCKHPEHCAGG
ncbi:MAG: LPS-assembly protein LptD [Rhodospirillaceae bacterium]|nr:LPS-assembly protein LptD [Rhodospirillaceae bacterium]